MRFLFVTFPVASHYFPMVPLGWALAAAGHEVRVASHPSFLPTVESAGLTGVGVGKEPDLHWIWQPGAVAPLDDPDAGPAERLRAAQGLTMFAEVGADMAADLLPWARSFRPDLVVYEPRALAGVIVAHVLGVPAVRHLWGVDHTLDRWPFERPVSGPVLERFGAGDADPHGRYTLDPCPPSLQVPSDRPGGTIRYLPYNGGGRAPQWLLDKPSRPRICVTWGTTLARQSGQIPPARAAALAAAATGAEVVVATTASQLPMLGELPETVRVVDSAPPLHQVLPTCAAVAHPGGSGTLLTAVSHGVPQVVVPALGDQFLNARQLAATGAGVMVPEDEIGAALSTVLSGGAVPEAARRLADEAAASPTPADVVATLVEGASTW